MNSTIAAFFTVDPYEWLDNEANDNRLVIKLTHQGWGKPFLQTVVKWRPENV